MRLLDFNIDYDDFNSQEQKEISVEYVNLCCKAIEDITGIHRSEWMNNNNRDDKVCYAWSEYIRANKPIEYRDKKISIKQ